MSYVFPGLQTQDISLVTWKSPQNTGALGHSVPEGKQDKNTGMSITSLDVEN